MAKDLSTSEQLVKATTDKVEKKAIAQSPDAIRKKLEQREAATGGSSGKAVFGAKDIENVEEKRKAKLKSAEAKKTGKATFESKDLSKKP